MGKSIDPALAEFAVARLLDPAADWKSLVRDMAARWPAADPVDLVLALIEAASAIEHAHARRNHGHDGAARGYRLAALLSLDLHIMVRLGLRRTTAADLAAYWQTDAGPPQC